MTIRGTKPDNVKIGGIKNYRLLRSYVVEIFERLQLPQFLKELLLFPLDFLVLIARLLKDSKVSIWTKLELFLGVLYVFSPYDVIPDYLPGIGIIDDILIFIVILQHVFVAAGKIDAFLLKRYWFGNPKTLALIRGLFLIIEEWLSRFVIVRAIYKILQRTFKDTGKL